MPMLSYRNTDAALLVLRVIAGTIFMAHGAQKLFTFTIPGVTQAMAGWGVPLPGVAAPLVTAVELLGGLALVIGLLTRPAAVALAIDMLSATLLVHLPNGFFIPMGVEFTLMLFGAAAALALAGAGAWSADALFRARRNPAPQST